MAAGFATGIGTGIAIGISSGQKKGQEKVWNYLEKNEIALFDQDGNRITIDELKSKTVGACCESNKASSIAIAVAVLVALLLAGVVLAMVLS